MTTRSWVLALLGLALVLRVGVALAVAGDYAPQNDAAHYDAIASSMAAGDGYGPAIIPPAEGPSAFRAPLYPASLAAVYVVFGEHSWRAGLVAQALVGTVLVGLVGVVAQQLFGRRVALVAVALAAVHPALILIGSSLQHEPLLVVCTLAAVAAALQHRHDPRLRWAVAAGAALGLAGLTRELGLLAAPPVAWLLWRARPTAPSPTPSPSPIWSVRALAVPAVAAVVAVAVIAPWTIRNALRFDTFVPVSTSSGYGLVGTFNETNVADGSSWGEWMLPYEDPAVVDVMLQRESPTETELDADLQAHAVEVVADDPGFLLRVMAGNTYRLLDLDGGEYNRTVIARFTPYPLWLMWPAILASAVALGLAVVGATRRAARAAPFAVWTIPLATLVFMIAVLPANIRYRASIEPFVVLLAAVAVTEILDRRRSRTSGRSPGSSPASGLGTGRSSPSA